MHKRERYRGRNMFLKETCFLKEPRPLSNIFLIVSLGSLYICGILYYTLDLLDKDNCVNIIEKWGKGSYSNTLLDKNNNNRKRP